MVMSRLTSIMGRMHVSLSAAASQAAASQAAASDVAASQAAATSSSSSQAAALQARGPQHSQDAQCLHAAPLSRQLARELIVIQVAAGAHRQTEEHTRDSCGPMWHNVAQCDTTS
jgi:hypothetical protein